MNDFGYTRDSAPPPGGRAWLDDPPVVHGRLWQFGEWLLVAGNIETVMCVTVIAAFAVLMVATWLVS